MGARRRWIAAALAGAVASAAGAGLLFHLRTRAPLAKTSGEAPSPLEADAKPDDPLALAWRAVVDHPREMAAWLALGDLQSARDQPDAAEHSYRTAVRLAGTGGARAYARLGFLLYGRGDDQSALVFLSEAKSRGEVDAMLDFTLRAIRERAGQKTQAPEAEGAGAEDAARDGGSLRASEEPPDGGLVLDAGPGAPAPEPQIAARTTPAPFKRRPPRIMGTPPEPEGCAVTLSRTSERGGFIIDAELDGVPARLLLDTGATITVLGRELVDKMGATEDPARQIRVLTANGATSMALASVKSFSVGGRAVEGALVGVCDGCVRGIADGLLGLDLQAALGMELELGHAKVRFADCEGP